ASTASLTSTTDITQNEAVSQLMSDVGISIKMQYSCSGSGAWPSDALTALVNNFKYNSTASLMNRQNYTATDWMNAIESELNAPTPRPIMFSIYDTSFTVGHEVVIDGYQNIGGTDQAHINYGWGGMSDAYYDITNNWTDYSSFINWSANGQELLIGIQPLSFTLTVTDNLNVTDNGNGAVTASSGTLSWSGNTGTGSYYGGQQVTLTATPQSGYTFAGWGGSCSGTGTCLLAINSNANVTAAFNANGTTYSISGTVKTSNGAPMAGVSAALSGKKAGTTTTDSNGNYSFTGLPNGSYTIALSQIGYVFGPSTSVLSINGTNATGQNFTGTPTVYTITPAAGANGSITPSSAVSVGNGGSQSFTITPNSGYFVGSVSVDGISAGAVSMYSFNTVTANHKIAATFTNTYTVTPLVGAGGSISPSSAAVKYDGTTKFTATPNKGYHVSSVTGCGGTSVSGSASVTSPVAYTTGAITSPCSVTATFELNSYSVTPSAGLAGSMVPATAQTVDYDSTATFEIVPNIGCHITSVKGCGGTAFAGSASSTSPIFYTTGAITAACTVTAGFEINTYQVTSSAGTGGSISPATKTVNYDGSAKFTVTPKTGYSIASVTGCGAGTLVGNTYTTGAITSTCSVSATFVNGGPVKITSSATTIGTSSSTTGGTISPSLVTVYSGGVTSFTVTPKTGYSIASVTGCSGSLAGNTYTTGNITSPCSVSAAFQIATYKVTPSAGAGGTMGPATAQTVIYAGTTSFTVAPNKGYYIASVTGCGGKAVVGSVSSTSQITYTTGYITSACSVTATFGIIQTLTINKAGSGSGSVTANSGTITWSGSTGTASYISGTSVKLTAAAASGSTFTSWTGCDSTSGKTCTVSMTAAKNVTALFGT
ncbi:MAG: C10 family peptidase, partial [Dissulfurispiraceae bacterium]